METRKGAHRHVEGSVRGGCEAAAAAAPSIAVLSRPLVFRRRRSREIQMGPRRMAFTRSYYRDDIWILTPERDREREREKVVN